jgi:hypothetical protein
MFFQVDADLRAVSFTLDPKERKGIQRETLSALFETYFRILKHSMSTSNLRWVLDRGFYSFRLGLITTGFSISPITSDVWMLIGSIKHRLMTK